MEEELVKVFERWRAAPHPGLMRPVMLDFEQGWLVREWIDGFTLVELLRVRSKLRADECLRLAGMTAELLDHVAAQGLLSAFGIDKLFVVFGVGVNENLGQRWLREPMDQWPAWSLRLEPLRIANLVSWAEQPTMRQDAADGNAASVVCVLHRLVRELAGGAMTRADSPLAAFSDAANRVLQNATRSGSFGSAQEFATALAHAAQPVTPVALQTETETEQFTVQAGSPRSPSPGQRLFLEPVNAAARPLQLVARAEFLIGRSAAQADLAARFNDSVPDATGLTKCIGRIHLHARATASGILLFDGTEAAPSQNGSFTSEGQLPQAKGSPLLGPTIVQLGSRWRVTLIPAPASLTALVIRQDVESADGQGIVREEVCRGPSACLSPTLGRVPRAP